MSLLNNKHLVYLHRLKTNWWNEGDLESPLFILKINYFFDAFIKQYSMNETIVRDLVEEALALNKDLFLIAIKISVNNKIQVVVDGDFGVPLSECIRISRNVEHNLDREEEDFSLEVTSPDISHPIMLQRQYKKNINRLLQVKTATDEFLGTLTQVTDDFIELQWKTREPKPIGKGKVTVQKTATFTYKEIKEAKVKIVF